MKISSASKKVLASALSAAMVVAFAPTAAFAAVVTPEVAAGSEVAGTNYVATVVKGDTGDTYKFVTLWDAMEYAQYGDTVNMLSDIYLADINASGVSKGHSLKPYFTSDGAKYTSCGDTYYTNADAGTTYYTMGDAVTTDDSNIAAYQLDVTNTYARVNGATLEVVANNTGIAKGDTVRKVTQVQPTEQNGWAKEGDLSGKVTAATAAKYENLKTGYTGDMHYSTKGSVNGNGHKIVIENLAAEDVNGSVVDIPNITDASAILTVNADSTYKVAVSDLTIEDTTDVDPASATVNGSTATSKVEIKGTGLATKAATTTGTDVPGLKVSGLKTTELEFTGTDNDGNADVNATLESLKVNVSGTGNFVKVTGGTYTTVKGQKATLKIAGGTFAGKLKQAATTAAVIVGTNLDDPASAAGVVTVQTWADQAAKKVYNDEYYAAVDGATILGGTINGYAVNSDLYGGTFASDPTKVTGEVNTVADNYVYANGAISKGIKSAQAAITIPANLGVLTKDVAATSYDAATGALIEEKGSARTDSFKAVAAAGTKVVTGLAATDKLYKDMYNTDGTAKTTASVAVTNETVAFDPASRGIAAKEEANAIVSAAQAAAVDAKMAGVRGIALDTKGAITAGSVYKIKAAISAGNAANAVKISEFGPVAVTLDLGTTCDYTSAVLLFSEDGKAWSAAQTLSVTKAAATTTNMTKDHYYASYSLSKAGYYAIAYSTKANDEKVKAEEEAKKAAEEAAAKLIATQDASAAKDVKGVNKTYKSKSGKLAATKTFKLEAVTSESGATVAYKKANTAGKSKITVSKAGKVTLKKGLKKGKYSLKVKGTVGASSKTVTCKIVIK